MINRFNYVRNYITEMGYTLLETEYINAHTKMNIKCFKCNNIFDISFNKFKSGKRCRYCKAINTSKRCKLDPIKVKEEFEKENWKLIDFNYINNSTPMKCVCPKGHEQLKRFGDFQQGSRCLECFNEIRGNSRRPDYNTVKEYVESFNYELISSTYIKSQEKLELRCDKGHLFKIRFNNFKLGVRCVHCYKLSQFGETNVRYQPDRTRKRRMLYLSFNHRNSKILKDDTNYNNYIISKNIKSKTEYQVDHIYPRVAFIDNNLDIIYNKNLIKEICNSRNNLQIIHQTDNNYKAGKYIQEEFMNWFENKLIIKLMKI